MTTDHPLDQRVQVVTYLLFITPPDVYFVSCFNNTSLTLIMTLNVKSQ